MDAANCSCGKGYTSGPDGGTCVACVAGTYKDANGSTPCTKCSRGKYSTGAARISEATCDDCPANAYSGPGSTICTCIEGHTGPDGGVCTACVAGTFKDLNGSSPCTLCSPGKYSMETGEILELTCDACTANSDAPAGSDAASDCICNAGFTSDDAGGCVACAAGTCEETCNVGYTNREGGSCEACPPGTWKNVTGNSNCTACLAGKYSEVTAAVAETTCQKCPNYSTSEPGSSRRSSCQCERGFQGVGERAECVLCSFGKYKDGVGNDECKWCAANHYTVVKSGAKECIACLRNMNSFAASYGISSCACNDGYSGPSCLISKVTLEDTRSPNFREFQLDIDLEIVATNFNLPEETEKALLEISNFFSTDLSTVVVKNTTTSRRAFPAAAIRRMLGENQSVGNASRSLRQSGVTPVSLQLNRQVASLRQTVITPMVVQAVIARDFEVFSVDSEGSAAGLESFFQIRGLNSVAVKGFTTYCGAGYEEDLFNRSGKGQTCVQCQVGTFKQSTDNSACVPCGGYMTTTSVGSKSIEDCVCITGYRLQAVNDTAFAEHKANQASTINTSRREKNDSGTPVDSQCVLISNLDPQTARSVSQAVGGFVAAVVGTNVAVTVGAAVASSIGTAVGGGIGSAGAATTGSSNGLSASGGGAASCLPLISQVQFLNVMGRVGGSNGSASMFAFTSGLGWANYEGLLASGKASGLAARRKAKARPQDEERKLDCKRLVNAAGPESMSDECEELLDQSCDLSRILPSLEQFASCAACVAAVAAIRSGVALVIKLLHKDVPPSLMFPCWEVILCVCVLTPQTFARSQARTRTNIHLLLSFATI